MLDVPCPPGFPLPHLRPLLSAFNFLLCSVPRDYVYDKQWLCPLKAVLKPPQSKRSATFRAPESREAFGLRRVHRRLSTSQKPALFVCERYNPVFWFSDVFGGNPHASGHGEAVEEISRGLSESASDTPR